jgi:heme exporter protein CcmD
MISIHWATWADFARMNGYGGFVWGSVGATLALLALEWWALGRRHAAARRALAEAAQDAAAAAAVAHAAPHLPSHASEPAP